MELSYIDRVLDGLERMLDSFIPKRNYRILVIEDDYSLEPIIRRALTKSSDKLISTDWVATVSEAELRFEVHHYDLIICDILLAGSRTGLDFWELCQKICPKVPFIIMSSIPREQVLEGVGTVGKFTSFLQKPFQIGDFQKITAQSLHLNSFQGGN